MDPLRGIHRHRLDVAGAASFFPAWRATLLSPMVAIRNEPGSTWQSARQTVQRAMQGISRAVSATDERRTCPRSPC